MKIKKIKKIKTDEVKKGGEMRAFRKMKKSKKIRKVKWRFDQIPSILFLYSTSPLTARRRCRSHIPKYR
jgi:hypothetical protein